MSRSHYIPEDFSDAEYLYAYAEDFLNTKIATQIRVLREQRGLTQEELAKKIGTKQPGIARLENVNYSAWKIETLKKLARAFDVIFIGGFISLSTFIEEEEKFGRKMLEQPRYQDEIAEQEKSEGITSSVWVIPRVELETVKSGEASIALREKIVGEEMGKQNQEPIKQLPTTDKKSSSLIHMADYLKKKQSFEREEGEPYAAISRLAR
jgi:transcriptional regulator with XRE-family HTH domain